MQKQTIEPSPKDFGRRLDVYLADYFLGEHSRTYLQKLIKEKFVLVNGTACSCRHKIAGGDKIELFIPPVKPQVFKAENIPLRIIYEDNDILIVDKPCGMVTHPGAGIKNSTLVNALLYHCRNLSSIGGTSRPGIVHRLDKDTSGIMLVAKNDFAHRALANQFRQRKVERKYIAIVKGVVRFDNDQIDLPIGKHLGQKEKMAVNFAESKDALTKYKVLERFSDATLLEILPITGRTHQIRVHMKAIGHPVLGDPKYGAAQNTITKKNGLPPKRQMLHAQWIKFFHPALKKYMEFSCSLPAEFTSYLASRKQSASASPSSAEEEISPSRRL